MGRALRHLGAAARHLGLEQRQNDLRKDDPAMPAIDQETLLESAEYLGLRSEIIDWQNRRLLVSGFAVTLFGAIIIQIMRSKSEPNADYVEWLGLILSMFLSIAWAFVAYSRKSSVMLGTYIQMFLEHDDPKSGLAFEVRNQRMKENTAKYAGVDKVILALFAFLLAASIAATWYATKSGLLWWMTSAGLSAAVFALSWIICHRFVLIDREKAIKDWNTARTEWMKPPPDRIHGCS